MLPKKKVLKRFELVTYIVTVNVLAHCTKLLRPNFKKEETIYILNFDRKCVIIRKCFKPLKDCMVQCTHNSYLYLKMLLSVKNSKAFVNLQFHCLLFSVLIKMY